MARAETYRRGIRSGLYHKPVFPAPPKLMKTSVSDQALDMKYSPFILNMIPSTGTSRDLGKRFGTLEIPAVTNINGEQVFYLIPYQTRDCQQQLLAFTEFGNVYMTGWRSDCQINTGEFNDDFSFDYDVGNQAVCPPLDWSQVYSGLDPEGHVRFDYISGDVLIVNGCDPLMKWDGTNYTVTEETVREVNITEWESSSSLCVYMAEDRSEYYQPGTTIDIGYTGFDLPITSLVASAGVVTMTTATPHNLDTDDRITVIGASPEDFNGTYQVTVTGANTLTYDTGILTLTATAIQDVTRMQMVEGTASPQFNFFEDITPSIETSTEDSTTSTKITIKEGASAFKFFVKSTDPAIPNVRISVSYRVVGDEGPGIPITQSGQSPSYYIPLSGLGEIKVESSGLERIDQYEVIITTADPAHANLIEVTRLEHQRLFDYNPTTNTNPFGQFQIVDINSINRVGNTATVSTAVGHGLKEGDQVTLFNIEQEQYNNTFEVTYVDPVTFEIQVQGEPATPATPDPNIISGYRYNILSNQSEGTILSSSFDATTNCLLVTFDSQALPGSIVEINRIDRKVKGPVLSDIKVWKYRAWGLSGGKLHPQECRETEQPFHVFYTPFTNNGQAWVDPNSGNWAFIDMTNSQGENDEFVGISATDQYIAFHGREHLQVWGGSIPTLAGDFRHLKTIPVGTVHGDLIQQLPNDILFLTHYGFRTLKNVFNDQDLEIRDDIGSDIDPTMEKAVDKLLESDISYRSARSFFYKRDGFYGFKVPDLVYIYVVRRESKGWVVFSGDFESARAFAATQDDRLILSNQEKVRVYANGVAGVPVGYSDNGQEIRWLWQTPWFENSRRYSNRTWEFIIENDTVRQFVELRRRKDNNRSNQQTYRFEVIPEFSQWDQSFWDVDFWDGEFVRPILDDQFIANSMSLIVEGSNTVGPFRILGIKAIGSQY